MGGYAPDIAYNLPGKKKPALRGWLGRVGGVTDVRRKQADYLHSFLMVPIQGQHYEPITLSAEPV